MDVSGKKAVVFGGTSGIGLAAAKQLAAKGCEVVAISRDPAKAGNPGAGITLKQGDVRDEAALQALFAECGTIDILVSAATGGDRAVGPFMDMDMQGFRNSFDKLWGYANVLRYGVGHLSDNGVAVLVSGIPARRPKPGQVAIGAVGGAVENLARTVAREIGPKRVNVVAPGLIDTPMVGLKGKEREDFYANANAGHPVKRAGTADEVAKGILFCVENDFVTGSTIDVDGGWLVS